MFFSVFDKLAALDLEISEMSHNAAPVVSIYGELVIGC